MRSRRAPRFQSRQRPSGLQTSRLARPFSSSARLATQGHRIRHSWSGQLGVARQEAGRGRFRLLGPFQSEEAVAGRYFRFLLLPSRRQNHSDLHDGRQVVQLPLWPACHKGVPPGSGPEGSRIRPGHQRSSDPLSSSHPIPVVCLHFNES